MDLSKVKFVQVVNDDDDDDLDNDAEYYNDENGQPTLYQQPSSSNSKEEEDEDDQDNNHNSNKNKKRLKSLYKADFTIASLYTGGGIQLSNDASFIVSTNGNSVCFTSTNDAIELATPIQFDTKVSALALSSNSKLLAVAQSNNLFQIYLLNIKNKQQLESSTTTTTELDEEESHKLIKQWRCGESPIQSIDFHSSGALVAIGMSDSTLQVWDVENAYCTHNFKDNGGVISQVKFQSKTLRLLAVCDDNKVRVWDLQSKTLALTLENHMATISSICLSYDQSHLITAGRDKVLNLWDLKSNSPIKTIPIFQELGAIIPLDLKFMMNHADTLPADVITRLNKIKDRVGQDKPLTLVMGGEDVLRIWCMETGDCIWNDQGKEFKKKKSNDINNDNNTLFITSLLHKKDIILSITSEHNIIKYDSRSLNRQGEIIGYNDEIVDIKYINSNTIAMATNSNEIRCYNLDSRQPLLLRGHTDLVLSIDVSHDGKSLISASKDNTIRLWDTNSFECIGIGKGHTSDVTSVAISRKGSPFVLSASNDRTLKLWKWSHQSVANTLQVQKTIVAHEKEINCIAVAPNDKIFATASQDSFIKIWNLSDLSMVTSFKAHKRGVWYTEFSPVDQCLVTCSADSTIKIWSMSDYSCLKTFEGHSASVMRACFVSYGMQILSAGSDGLIKLWTIKSNECVNTFEGHDSKIWALAVHSNNKDKDYPCFVSGGSDSKIIKWSDHTVLEQEKSHRLKENQLLNQQMLDTSLHNKDYTRSLKLALILNQPNQTLRIFIKIYQDSNNNSSRATTEGHDSDNIDAGGVGEQKIRESLLSLGNTELVKCLKYVRDWNTNSRYVYISQIVLNSIITLFKPEDMISIKELPTLLESLIPYNERHFQRIDRTIQKTYLLDYTIANINPSLSKLFQK